MSEDHKQQLTLQALGILREQVEARVVHYKAELETSAELDAVTAQVVKQIQDLQAAAVRDTGSARDPELLENAHAGTLSGLLESIFVKDQNYIARSIQPIGRRLAKLFFENELNVSAVGELDKTIHHAEQGLFYLLKRYKGRMETELGAFEYASEDVKLATAVLLKKTARDLQVAFLSRRSPELNRVMSTFTVVLTEFFTKHIPSRLPQMARVTVRNAQTAHQPDSVPYKILPSSFTAFRTEWERVLMTQMIHFCGDELIARLEEGDEPVREETVNFFTEPGIYSATCDVICDGLYDRLCLEGFLDLPVDWRVQMGQGTLGR